MWSVAGPQNANQSFYGGQSNKQDKDPLAESSFNHSFNGGVSSVDKFGTTIRSKMASQHLANRPK